MKFAKCGNCGAGLIEKGEEYVCEYCKRTYKDDSIKAAYEKVRVAMQETLQGVITEENLRKKNEQIANRRQSLYKARKSEFIDNEEVKFWSDEILKFLPNDTQATFYSLAASEKWTELNRFLAKTDGKTVPYLLEDFVDFLTNGRFVGKCMLQMQDLLARTFASGSDEYKNCQKLISEAAARDRSGIFDPCLPRDVFVAYSSKDKERVYELVEYLEDNGLNCFVAMRNLAKGVDAQRYYNERLKEAIDNCQVFVFVSSKNSRTRNCDAYDIEMMYVKERDLIGSDNPNYYNNNYSAYLESYRERCKPRVEWLVDEYGSSIYERQVKQFFCGLTWCTDKESVLDAVADHINNRPVIVTEKDKLSKENEALKAELERKRAELEKEQQEELSRQRAELERTKAEFEKKQQEELAKQIAEFEKQKSEFEKQKAELARRRAEMESERAKMQTEKAERTAPIVSATVTPSKTDEKENEQAKLQPQAQVETIEQPKAPKFTEKGCDYSIKSAKQAEEEFAKALQAMREKQAQAKAQEQAKSQTSIPATPLSDFEIVNGVLKKYKGKGGEVIIPDEVETIGSEAFTNCSTLTSIKFTKNSHLTKIIGAGAFSGAFSQCRNLKSIQIPAKLKSISGAAFYCCTGLESVEITDLAAWCNVRFFGKDSNPLQYAKNLYLNGKLLTDLEIPDSVTSISANAFDRYIALKSVNIPNSVTSIGSHAFCSCVNLERVKLPNSITSIADSTFDGCKNLTSIEIPNSVTSIGNYAFRECAKLKNIAIPYSVTRIGDLAFCKCVSLNYIVIPDNVNSLGVSVFRDCIKLDSVVINKGVSKINKSMFSGCGELTKVIFHSSVTTIGAWAFSWCGKLTRIEIPKTVTTIEKDAFKYCNALTIYAEVKKKPKGWVQPLFGKDSWNPEKRPVHWGYKEK